MTALFILMLKMTIPWEKLSPKRLEVGNNEDDEFGIGDSLKYIKKSEKTSKFQNLVKLGKKLSKSENFTNFNAIEARAKFLTLDAKTTFNHL